MFYLILFFFLQKNDFRIANYNIMFLSDQISKERQKNIQQVIQELNADAICLQEIKNEKALRLILDESYQIRMLDDPQDEQDVAFAIRKPHQVLSYRFIYDNKQWESAFPKNRNLLEIRCLINNDSIRFLVIHAKSRGGKGRLQTDSRRIEHSDLIVKYIQSQSPNIKWVLSGDFNDSPDDPSLNILESGNPKMSFSAEEVDDGFLFNCFEELWATDHCSYDLFSIADSSQNEFSSRVLGARSENQKFFGIEYNYRTDVKIKQTLLDQILISQNLKKSLKAVSIFNKKSAIMGSETKVKFKGNQVEHTFKGSLSSDHLPVYIDLRLN